MNSILLTFIFLCIPFVFMYSQVNNTLDEIYLKNGKTVEGIIQKRELGVITVQVFDSVTYKEKVQRYQQADVLKIIHNTLGIKQEVDKDSTVLGVEKSLNFFSAKVSAPSNNKTTHTEMPESLLADDESSPINSRLEKLPAANIIELPNLPQSGSVSEGEQSAAPIDPSELNTAPRSKRYHTGWYRQIKGFRMFLDYGLMIGVGDTKNNKMEFGTSLGYQFNPIFYIGAGTVGALSLNKKDHSMPVFINGRVNFMDNYITPYLDLRTGYSVLEGKGFYFSSSVGVSFTKRGKEAFNIGLTYTSQNVKYYEWERGVRSVIREAQHGLGLRITFEF